MCFIVGARCNFGGYPVGRWAFVRLIITQVSCSFIWALPYCISRPCLDSCSTTFHTGILIMWFLNFLKLHNQIACKMFNLTINHLCLPLWARCQVVVVIPSSKPLAQTHNHILKPRLRDYHIIYVVGRF